MTRRLGARLSPALVAFGDSLEGKTRAVAAFAWSLSRDSP
jgi:hypothetical protein